MTAAASIRPYLNQAYLLGLLMVAVGLTLSPFLMGMSQFWLLLVWIVDGVVGHDFKQKLTRFWRNKAAVLLVAFYLLHVVGLLWTTDIQYAMKDLRVKLPILVMPFVLASMPSLDRKRFDLILNVYVLSVFVATLFSFNSYKNMIMRMLGKSHVSSATSVFVSISCFPWPCLAISLLPEKVLCGLKWLRL